MLETKNARPGAATLGSGTEVLNDACVALPTDYHHYYTALDCNLQQRLALRPGELAEVLGIGRNAAYKLCSRADFPTVTVGRKIVVPVDGLRRWLEEQAEDALAQAEGRTTGEGW